MPEQALYLKWRPTAFEDIVGQEHITRTLRNALKTQRVRHAYLFSGPRGTGKTTTARLLAKALNWVRLINVWRVPSVLATLVGLAVGVAGIEVWPPLMHAIRMLGDIAIPLMLFALGVRLTDSRITSIGLGVFAAVLRPVSGMVLAWLVMLVIDLPPREQALLLVFGALPPAVLNYIFAERYRQEPEKVASMVLIGNVTALLFLPLALALSLE